MNYMFGFKKHCQICGIDVTKESAVKRFGKNFCSDEHAERYAHEVERIERKRMQRKKDEGCGCC